MKENQTLYALTGALAVGLIAIGMALGLGGSEDNRAGYLLYATFEQADGLSAGSPVYLAGVKVGAVEKMTLNAKTLKPRVAVRIREKTRIPEESAAMIMSDGVLGGKYIKIEPGSGDEMMSKGSTFELVQDSIIVEDLLERIVEGAEAARKGTKDTR